VTLLDAFEGRRMLIAYYFMWHTGHPSARYRDFRMGNALVRRIGS
jgi:hypothetical protein